MSPPSPDRREPLPSLLELPVFLFRNLSPRGRRLAGGLGLVLVLAIAAGLIVFAPDARRSESERAARADRARGAAAQARRAQANREARPRTARGPAATGLRGTRLLRARTALFAAVEASVLADARARRRRGELRGPPYRTSACFAYPKSLDRRPPARDLAVRVARLECLAVTSVVAKDERTTGSLIGQPYRARVDFATGRYAWCKIVQRPGELAVGRPPPVRVPPQCGGTR